MKRILRKIHLWLSVPFGLIITITCLSGAALVFEEEITALCRPELHRIEHPGSEPLPMGQILRSARQTLPSGTDIAGISIPHDPDKPWRVNLTKPHRASLSVNPYTGEVLGRNERLPFFNFMFRAHRWLLDGSRSVGKTVVGTSTMVFAFILLTGLALWWPRRRRAIKSGLTISTRKGMRRFWFDLHNAGGFYALLLLLVMALTGLTWSFGWYRSAFYRLFGAEVQAAASKPSGKQDRSRKAENNGMKGKHQDRSGQQPDFTQWEKVYKQLRDRHTDYRQITISEGTASVSGARWGNQRAADRYAFQPKTGRLTEATPYAEAKTANKLRGWIYSVHVGNWGGWLTRILWFCAALIGASLPLTGYYLWWKRTRKKGCA